MGEAPASPRRGVRRGVYVLPALFTVGNVFCGYLSMDAAVRGRFDFAAMLIFAAAILDGLDGRVARWAGATSAFGEQLDSLADVVSFGVAPAFLVYRWGLIDFGRAGLLVSFLFVVCGACRLARFNVQLHVVDKRYFVGLPIPSAAGALCGLIWVLSDSRAYEIKAGFLAVTAILSWLMVSTFRYRSFKDVDLRSRRAVLIVPFFVLVFGLFWVLRQYALASTLSVYAASAPLVRLFGLLRGRQKQAVP
ncbi:MAG: CDP-diacylglycerol--serine O-phosphatidyltransferase [Thermoanaerobaculia bacterium]|nr:CDP-diacylglycerol--serine O-phosphatidyltransferase [Thermoanaerobaculia bacterium]